MYFQRSVRHAVERARVVVTQTEAVRREVIEYFTLAPEKVSVGGDGLSGEFTALADATPTTAPQVPVLFFVGQLSKKKNIAWLVRTLRRGIAGGAIPEVRLVLAGGEGFGIEEIRSEIVDSGNLVEWLDRPSLSQIVSQYRSCSAVVLPSLREGFGRPLLEAFYCDKPVIASRIPTSVEIAGESGHFFSLDDTEEFYSSVRNALRDTRRSQRVAIASEILQKYSWRNLSGIYLNIYRTAGCQN